MRVGQRAPSIPAAGPGSRAASELAPPLQSRSDDERSGASSRLRRATPALSTELLPTPLGAVEDREARGDQVRRDRLGVALAPEEELRVELGSVKDARPLYGVERRHLLASRDDSRSDRAASAATYSSRRLSCELDVARAPELALCGAAVAHRPRAVATRLASAEPAEDDP